MCGRGHSDRWRRRHRNGHSYCRRCQTIAQWRRYHGLEPLEPLLGRPTRKLNRMAFTERCRQIRKAKRVVLELAGVNGDSLGAAYARGLALRHQVELSRLLGVEQSKLFECAR